MSATSVAPASVGILDYQGSACLRPLGSNLTQPAQAVKEESKRRQALDYLADDVSQYTDKLRFSYIFIYYLAKRVSWFYN